MHRPSSRLLQLAFLLTPDNSAQGRLAEARAAAEAALEAWSTGVEPRVVGEAHMALGNVLRASNDLAAAEVQHRAALALCSDLCEAEVRLCLGAHAVCCAWHACRYSPGRAGAMLRPVLGRGTPLPWCAVCCA